MGIDKIEAEALKLDRKERARLAGKLLESLESLSHAENEEVWAEEARRRDEEMDRDSGSGTPAEDVFRDARSRLK